MKAYKISEYGGEFEEVDIEKPQIKEDEVLIKVKAVSLNSSDVEYYKGKPAYIRAWGLRKPGVTILGSDVSGIVVEVGVEVKNFKVGDEVFGDNFDTWGGFGEFVNIKEKRIVKKPKKLDFDKASAIPQGGGVALQSLKVLGGIEGKEVLVVGAGGGTGVFAVQLAKLQGANVSGVDKGEKEEILRDLGIDNFIDYEKVDYTVMNKKYDLIVDLVGSHSIWANKEILREKGTYKLVGGSISRIFASLFFGFFISRFSKKKMGLHIHKITSVDSEYLSELYLEGLISIVIDKRFSIDKVEEGMKYLAEGKNKGKIVIEY